MDLGTAVGALGVAALATLNVGVWTVRVALAARGRRGLASLAAGVDAVLFVVAFHTVLSSLDDPVRVAAYALGVALGTNLGLAAEGWTRGPRQRTRGVTAPQGRRWRRVRQPAVPAPPSLRPAGGAVPQRARQAVR